MAQQNVEVRIVGKDQASSELLRVGNTLERMKVSVESNRAGFNKLDGALKESARNLVGLQGSAGQVTSALLSFAPQSIFITAAIAGVGLLVKTFIDLAEAQKKAEADTKAALQGYVDAWGDVKMQIRNVNIGQEFTELDVITEKIEKLKEEIENCNSLCVHIRRGDYIGDKLHEVVNEEYYKKAISYMEEKKVKIDKIYIFSDDISWCEKNLKFNYNTQFVGEELSGEKAEGHLYLMSNCKNFIIPNSTFSWWGAWLSRNKNKVVIAPKQWFGIKFVKWDIIPGEWVQL